MHFELLNVTATAPSAGASGAAVGTDSLVIKNSSQSGGVQIIAMWSTQQFAGFSQVAYPSGHDTTRGFRVGGAVGVNPCLLPFGHALEVTPQELLAVTLAGSIVIGDVEQLAMLVHYGNLPGVAMRTISPTELNSRTHKRTTVEASIVSTAGPSYGTPVAINAGSDLLIANRDYAVLGATCRTAVHTMHMTSPDFSNVRIGVPGMLRYEFGSQYFVALSRAHGLPLIPVINSGNKANVLIGVNTDENAGTFVTTWHLALLK